MMLKTIVETLETKPCVFQVSLLKYWTPLHFSQGKFSSTDGKPEKKGALYELNSGPTEHINFTLRLTFGLLQTVGCVKCDEMCHLEFHKESRS